MLYFLGVILGSLLRGLPRSWGYATAHVVGLITFVVWKRGRTCLRENMGHILGDGVSGKQLDDVVKRAFRNYLKYLADFVCLPAAKPDYVLDRVAFQSIENLGKALESGRGGILVGLHQGNWEITGAAVVMRGYPLNVIVESFDSPRLDAFMQKRRWHWAMKVIPMENGVAAMVDALRRNELLALLIDIPGESKGVEVRFCDAITQMPRGAATLALKTGAKIVPIASMRLPDDTFICYADECLDFKPSGRINRDVKALTQMIMDSLERYVRQYPDQYYMFRRMWPRNTGNGDSPDTCSRTGTDLHSLR